MGWGRGAGGEGGARTPPPTRPSPPVYGFLQISNGFGWISCMWICTFWQIVHVSGLEMTFWGNFIMVLHGFASRSPKNTVLRPKTLKYDQKPKNKTKNQKINPEIFQVNIVEACSLKIRIHTPLGLVSASVQGFEPWCRKFVCAVFLRDFCLHCKRKNCIFLDLWVYFLIFGFIFKFFGLIIRFLGLINHFKPFTL